MRQNKIKSDIDLIKTTLMSGKQAEIEELYEELVATYATEVKDLEKSLLDVFDSSVFFHNINADSYNQLPEKKYPDNYKKNLKIIQGRLELLLDNDTKSNDSKGLNITIHNDNKSSASSSVTMNINITFEDVKNQINSMEDVLGYDEVQLINSKIDELQKIIESNSKKSEKWKNAKAIGKWIFDRSVDVGIALLPLILKINQ